jgi:hypothetical protein
MVTITLQSKVAVVTAITGGKDELLPAPVFDGVDCFLFTPEVPDNLKGWTSLQLPEWSNLSRADRRNAKLPKIMPFLFLHGYEFVLWQDGGHRVAVNPRLLIQKYLVEQDKDIAAFMHGKAFGGEKHDCVYLEAENIKRIGFLEDPKIIDEQVAAYKAEGYPEHYGLSCNASMIWHNTPEVWRLQLAWWEQVCRYSSRDQMSFFYTLWKTEMKDRLTYIDGHWERNGEIPRLRGHVNPRK